MPVEQREILDRETWLEWRQENINASEGACLFGDDAHPYLSAYRLWGLRSKLISEAPDSPEKARGRLFEPVAIDCLRLEKRDWQIVKAQVYLFDPEIRLGATPDVYAWRQGERTDDNPGGMQFGIVQMKTSGHYAFREHWRNKDTGEVEVPLWIAVQASIEAYLAGATWAAVAVMTTGDGGVGFHVEEVPLRAQLIQALLPRVADFWRRVRDNDPYPVDWQRDSEAVLEVYRDADGELIDLTRDPEFGSLLAQRASLAAVASAGHKAEEQRKIVDRKIIGRLGNAWGARSGGAIVTAKVVRRGAYTVEATEYRRVHVKGAKA